MKPGRVKAWRLVAVLVAAVSLWGCCGFAFAMPKGGDDREEFEGGEEVLPKPTYVTPNETQNSREAADPIPALTVKDSLLLEMVDFLAPGSPLSKAQKRAIEARIKGFPHRIVRRDTAMYFIETAYAMVYYEFYKKDYKKALGVHDEFKSNLNPKHYWAYFFSYPSVQSSASMALSRKGKFKVKKDKQSWNTSINITLPDSITKYKRTSVDFVQSLLSEIPTDLNIQTLRKLLTFYHDGGGKLARLNGYGSFNFFNKYIKSGREDVLAEVYDIWEVGDKDFEVDQKTGALKFKVAPLVRDSTLFSNEKWREFSLSINPDPKAHEHWVDSLIMEGNDPSYNIIQLLAKCFNASRFDLITDYCRRYVGQVNPNKIMTLYNYWGLGCSYLGDHEQALANFDRAIYFATDPHTRSTIRMNKACTLGELGRIEEAAKIFMEEKDSPTTPFEKFTWYDNLGHIYSYVDPDQALRYFDQAEQFMDASDSYDERKIRHFCRKAQALGSKSYLRWQALDRALQYTKSAFPSKIGKGMAYTELGNFNSQSFNYEEADRNFREAYAAYADLLPQDYRLCRLNLSNARNLCLMNRHAEAAKILTRQLALQDSVLGPDNSEILRTLQVLISALAGEEGEEGTTREALQTLFTRYSALFEKWPAIIPPYDDITTKVDFYNAVGRHPEALALLSDVLSNAEVDNLSSLQRIDLACRLEKLVRSHNSSSQYAKVCDWLLTPLKQDITESLLLLTDDDRKALQRPLQTLIDGFIAGGNTEAALSLSLFRKGLLFTSRQTMEKRLAQGRTTKSDYASLLQLRKDLNSAIAYSDTMKIPRLQTQITRLERKLNQALAADQELSRSLDRSLLQVQQKLRPEDIAIDFVRYFAVEKPQFGAFLIRSVGIPLFIHLGAENELVADESKIWAPFDVYLRYASDIYFCPDGALSNLPLEFAPSFDEPGYSQARLHRVFHLAEIQPSEGIGNEVVAVGVSDHNSPFGEGEALYRGNFTDLPNVRYELDLIADRLSTLQPKLLFNDDAIEENVKALDQAANTVLHFSTHGFYRGKNALREASGEPDNFDFNIARRMLAAGRNSLSGLMLRRGNLSWKVKEILDDEDDLLTAEEIEAMSFPQLRLTVLSACETALGDIDADGVWGLQRAFRMAGSKSVVCALRKVPDYETSFFMDAFYEKAAEGATIYDSFRFAQNALREEYPDNREIWTSFILIE